MSWQGVHDVLRSKKMDLYEKTKGFQTGRMKTFITNYKPKL
ncbi:hypothetical protein FM120_17715 [Sphingobacterium faecium PCAi_F2.5]|nr:hypothetical protein FM120_17715 [Sphingobacterium faecium PCAi_F2.5]